jgi:hypothetical protein
MEFYFRRLFFVSTFAPSTGNNNLIDGAFETASRKAASPQQSSSELGFAFGLRAL